MNEINDVKNYYEDFWLDKNIKKQEMSDLREYEKEARKYVFNFLMNCFGDLKNRKILEIGPGKGYDLISFAKKGAKVTGIDLSKKSLELSKKLAIKYNLSRNIKLIEMDAHNLKFKKNEFDIVFIVSTLMHLNYLKVVRECKRVMKKNGALVLIEPINNNILIKLYRLFFSEYKEINPKYLNYNDLIKISKNFTKSHIKIFYLFSFISLVFRDNEFLYKMISYTFKNIEKIILKFIPSLEKNCWLSASVHIK